MITNEDQASIRSAPEKLIGVGVRFERIRRITGYLVGTVDRFNNVKRAEVRDRVAHLKVSPEAHNETPSRHDGDDGPLRRGAAGPGTSASLTSGGGTRSSKGRS